MVRSGNITSVCLALCVLGLGLVTCGGSPAPVEAPTTGSAKTTASRTKAADAPLDAAGAVGGMDASAVAGAVQSLQGQVAECVESGRKRVPYLGGSVAVEVRVDRSGRARQVFLASSTMGDHLVEGCIIKAFRAKQWPRPVGGEEGQVSQSFGFEPDHRGDNLVTLDGDGLAAKMGAEDYQELRQKLDGCRKTAGAADLGVTIYVDPDGFAKASGAASAGGKGAAAAECVSTLAATISFPSNDSGPLKISLSLP